MTQSYSFDRLGGWPFSTREYTYLGLSRLFACVTHDFTIFKYLQDKKVCPFHRQIAKTAKTLQTLRLSEERAQWQIGLGPLEVSILCSAFFCSYRVIRVPQCTLPHSAWKRCDYETSSPWDTVVTLHDWKFCSLCETIELAEYCFLLLSLGRKTWCLLMQEFRHKGCCHDQSHTTEAQLGWHHFDKTLTRRGSIVIAERPDDRKSLSLFKLFQIV